MEFILVAIIIVLAVVLLGAMGRAKSGSSPAARSRSGSRGSSAKQRTLDANQEWLRERWKMAEAEKAAGDLKHFPKWYFDEPTESQKYRIQKDGLSVSGKGTKGQYSDIIGLFAEPDHDELERLKFFGITLKGPTLNQARARYELTRIHTDPEKDRLWRMRPASATQKEFFRFVDAKPPAGLTFEQAETAISEAMDTLTEAQKDEWLALESLIEEFNDRGFRSDVEIRKPSVTDIRVAMAALKAEGEPFDDPYDVAEKLLEMKPSLARGGE